MGNHIPEFDPQVKALVREMEAGELDLADLTINTGDLMGNNGDYVIMVVPDEVFDHTQPKCRPQSRHYPKSLLGFLTYSCLIVQAKFQWPQEESKPWTIAVDHGWPWARIERVWSGQTLPKRSRRSSAGMGSLAVISWGWWRLVGVALSQHGYGMQFTDVEK